MLDEVMYWIVDFIFFKVLGYQHWGLAEGRGHPRLSAGYDFFDEPFSIYVPMWLFHSLTFSIHKQWEKPRNEDQEDKQMEQAA